jgi:hypothetical protein
LPYREGLRDPDRIIPSFYKGNMSARKGRYRIIRYADGSHQLFDVIEDYWQLRDLGPDHPAFASLRADLERCAGTCGFDFTVETGPVGVDAEGVADD